MSTEMYTTTAVTPNNASVASRAGSGSGAGSISGGRLTELMGVAEATPPMESDGSPTPVQDLSNALINSTELFLSTKQGLEGDDQWFPSPEDAFESTASRAKPLKAH